MRISRLHLSILFIMLMSIASMPIRVNTVADVPTYRTDFSVSEEVTGVPYVWQEVMDSVSLQHFPWSYRAWDWI